MTHGAEFERLVAIMARLRAPDGCPWDRKQTLDSLRQWLVEETYEVLDAIERRDVRAHCDELGDLLLQVVFQAQIRAEEGSFDVGDVARAIADKMQRRHPHVFGDAVIDDTAELRRAWAQIKAQEQSARGERRGTLDGVPPALPALLRALRLGQKAAGVGFDWPDVTRVMAKIDEERDELIAAMADGDPGRVEAELGDLLFSVVNLARHLNVDPETALHAASARFSARFSAVEAGVRADGHEISTLAIDALEARWQAAKRRLDGAEPAEGG
ncbi:MAG: nucleoside triphosphate pyrophosphohydrolase [Myxococcales bacterium]|nr:nucleoside triphosphate pyrophosphohydrolase [Myxococcales bacterium]